MYPTSESLKLVLDVPEMQFDFGIKKDYAPFKYSKYKKNLNNYVEGFKTELTENQKIVLKNILVTFSKLGTGILLNLPTGFGKTVLTLYIITLINEPTLILNARREIKAQWIDKINKFCPEHIKSKITVECEFSFYKSLFNLNSDYSVVIIDECHMNLNLVFTKILLNLIPKYLIGLSATPKCIPLMKMFFHKILNVSPKKSLTIHKVNLNFKPKVRYRFIEGESRLDYQYLVKTLCDNDNRTITLSNIIFEWLTNYKNLTGLVLVKRISNAKIISDFLESKGLIVNRGYGNNLIDRTSKINVLVGTYSRIGVGFDDPRFTIIFICDNIRDVRQAQGRVRSKTGIVVDFVDSHPIFEFHWNERNSWYEKIQT